jgi:hypothetical protein
MFCQTPNGERRTLSIERRTFTAENQPIALFFLVRLLFNSQG